VHVEVLRVVDVLVGARLDGVYDAVLEVEQDGARDIAGVVGLVEEDVLAVAALGRKVLQVAILVDAVLEAELLPELAPDWVRQWLAWDKAEGLLLLPHWPAWIVINSLVGG
jgi:hypothetical protein